MAPKKGKGAGAANRTDPHAGAESKTTHKESNAPTSLLDKSAPALPPPPSTPLGPPHPPLEAVPSHIPRHPHKNVNVYFDPVPTVLSPQRDRRRSWTPVDLMDVLTSADPRDRSFVYSDQAVPVDSSQLERVIVAPKHPYRTEQIRKQLDEVRAIHTADFALSQDALNDQPSTESMLFEDPVLPVSGKIDPTVPIEKAALVTDPDVVGMEKERVADLIEAKYELGLYPPVEPVKESIDIWAIRETLRTKPSTSEFQAASIAERSDMKVFFEGFPTPETTLDDTSTLLQISVAKRKKKLHLEAPTLHPTSSPSNNLLGSAGIALEGLQSNLVGRSTHDGSLKHKKNASPGKISPSLKLGLLVPQNESLSHGPATEKGKGGKSKLDKADTLAATDAKSNLQVSASGVPGIPSTMAEAIRTSRLDLGTTSSGRRAAGSAVPVSFDPNANPPPTSPEVVEEIPDVVSKPKIRTESWDNFFGQTAEEETHTDVMETGTGFDTVRGPTGLRKQFVEEEKNTGFFRQLLNQLVNKWVKQAVGKTTSPAEMTPRFSNATKKLMNTPVKEHGSTVFQPTLEDVLPIVRKVRDPNAESSDLMLAFAGASGAFTEKLERLQKMNFPRYDRGPQQTLLPIPGLVYEKMDNTVGILHRHWFHNPAEPVMTTYQSHLYPHYDERRVLITTEVPVLRLYAPVTCAKDIDYNPSDFTGVSGTPIDEKYITTDRLKQCNSEILDMLLKKETRQHLKTHKKATKHLPVTPRPERPKPHVTFSKPGVVRPKQKSRPDPFGKVSVNVVRRLNSSSWPQRLLPQRRKGARDPRYMEDTETWSVYLATQAKLIAAMRQKAAKDARRLRAFNPAEECYCRQPRIDRREKYVPPRKPRKWRVNIRVSRIAINRSFTGVHCLRLQKPVGPTPRFQHAGCKVPEQLKLLKTMNPMWGALHETMVETAMEAAKAAEKARRDAESKAEGEAAKLAMPLSVRPGELIRSASVGPSQVGLKGVSSVLQLTSDSVDGGGTKKSKLVANKSRLDAGKNTNTDAGGSVVSGVALKDGGAAPVVDDGNVSLAIPDKNPGGSDKNPVGGLKGLVAKHLKINPAPADGVAGQAAAADNLKTDRPAFANAVSGFVGSPNRGKKRSPTSSRRSPRSPRSGHTPDGVDKSASEWEDDPQGLVTYTFEQIPTDFNWDLLKCNATLDRLAEDSREVKETPSRDLTESPKLQDAAPPSVIDLESSSLNLLKCTSLTLPNSSGQDLILKEKLALKERREAKERNKRVEAASPLPAYMAGKHEKREKPVKVIKRSPSPIPVHTPPPPESDLMMLFYHANLRQSAGKKHHVPLTDTRKASVMFEPPPRAQPSSANQPVTPIHTTGSRQNFVGKSLTALGNGKNGLVHPRLQASLILRGKKSEKHATGTSASVGATRAKRTIQKVAFRSGKHAAGDSKGINHRQSDSPGDRPQTPAVPKKPQSKFAGKGSIYVSTAKTKPRVPLPRVHPYAKDKGNTAFYLDYEKAAVMKISRQVESFSKLKPTYNIKHYKATQSARKKFPTAKETTHIERRDNYILNDNFWRRKPPFVVAANCITGKNILPNLRHYLRKTHGNFSHKTHLPRNFKLDGEIGLAFSVKTKEDLEVEFQKKDELGRPLNIVQRCLRKTVLDRLAKLIPSTDNLRCILSHQKLRLFETESIDTKRQRLLQEWTRNSGNYGDAELLYKLPRQRALLAFIRRSRARLHTERLIRRYTGEYHYSHIARSLLKTKLNIPSNEPKVTEPPVDIVLAVPERSTENLEVERLVTQKQKKTPNSGKALKKGVASDADSEGATLGEDHHDASGTPGGGSKRESGATNVRAGNAGAVKDKNKPADSAHKNLTDSASTKFPGIEKHATGFINDKLCDTQTDHRVGQDSGKGPDIHNDEPPWWTFRPSECFKTPVKRTEITVPKPLSLFASQVALAESQPNPVDLLAQSPNLTFQERSLLDLVQLLKNKLATDERLAHMLEGKTAKFGGDESDDTRGQQEDGKGPPAPAERPRPDSTLMATAPAAVRATVKMFQDIASGGLAPTDGRSKGASTSSPVQETHDLTTAQLQQSLLMLHKDHLNEHDHADHHRGGNNPSRNRHTRRWMETQNHDPPDDTVRRNCHVNLGRENYFWQLPQISQLRRRVMRRWKYYAACIAYLHSLMPQTGSEVIMTTLQQLRVNQTDTGHWISPQSYKHRMGVLAKNIEELTMTTWQTGPDAFRNHLAAVILELELAKLYVKHHAEQIIQASQKRHGHELVARWNWSLSGGQGPAPNDCYITAHRTFERTPPPSPPRSHSPSKLKVDIVVEAPNDDDGSVRDKKGKGDKNADKNKGLKKSKDGGKEDKKSRIESENVGKSVGGKTSGNLKSSGGRAASVSDGKIRPK